MQIFEIIPLEEYPFLSTEEITDKKKVEEVLLDEENMDKAYLLVDHNLKKIWTYAAPKSSFKLQIFGGVAAQLLRRQLRLFYRVFHLNELSIEDKRFQEVLQTEIKPGRATELQKDTFPERSSEIDIISYMNVQSKLNSRKALEYLDELPHPDGFKRKFLIVGNRIYSQKEESQKFLLEQRTKKKPELAAQLNPGFTFFGGKNYSTRLSIKERKIQGIELFVKEGDQSPPMEINIPVIYKEKFSKSHNVKDLEEAFQIPDKYPDQNQKSDLKSKK